MRHFFFSRNGFPHIHRIDYSLAFDPPFDVVHGVQVFDGFQASDMVVVLFGGISRGHCH